LKTVILNGLRKPWRGSIFLANETSIDYPSQAMKGVRVRLILLYLAAALTCLSAWGDTQLTEGDVQTIIAQAATRAAQVDNNSIIAVVDRAGYVLGVWDVAGNPNPDVKDISAAIARAGTAAFLSSDQNAFTSRTAGYIIQQHFPPLVRDTANGPLVGVGISSVYLAGDFFSIGATNKITGAVAIDANLEGHSDVNFMKQIPVDMTNTFDPNGPLFSAINPFSPTAQYPALPGARSPGTFGAGIYTGTAPVFTVPTSAAAETVVATGSSAAGYVLSGQLSGALGTSLNDSPGGVPLYKNGELVGGVGVTGDGSPTNVSTGFAIIDGVIGDEDPLAPVEHPSNQQFSTPGFKEGPDTDEDVALAGQTGYEPSSTILATNDFIGGIQLPYVETSTSLDGLAPFGSIGTAVTGFPVQQSPPAFNYPAAEFGGVSGELRFPIRGDPMPGKIGKTPRLTAGEVTDIISKAAARSAITRAGIRLPVGVPAEVFISVVGNPGRTGKPPPILGVFRTGEATVFSWDVAVQKARTAYFFSNDDLALSCRTVGFLAQRYYPPGIDGTPPGPFFGVQEALLIDAFLGELHLYHANPYLPNQITIFPGGFPLYRNGVLIGAIGVSGDGVDQDDIISASGTVNFEAPDNIRADQFMYRGARLPYAKFPRDPGL
jgi:uncharacterized protein GlcG (DUF336 family)